MSGITKHFITLQSSQGERQVHYRKAGSGPLVVLLHQCPTSSMDFEPLMGAWASQFTLIAPDMPGYGLSDPFEVETPDISDYAQALHEFLEAIGAGPACFFGAHTGSAVAVEYAIHHPERVKSLVTNGYVVFSDEERDDILENYFIDFKPSLNGEHLTRLWSRIRDQVIYFPWYDKRPEARMAFDVPDPAALGPYILDFCRTGEGEPRAYRAAFCYPGLERARQLTVPAYLMAADPDPLSPHLDRLSDLPAQVTIAKQPSYESLFAAAHDIFAAFSEAQEITPPPSEPKETGPWSDYCLDAQVHVRRWGRQSSERPLVLIHSLGASLGEFDALGAELARERSVVAIDLLGHGETTKRPDLVGDFDTLVSTAIEAVRSFSEGPFDLVALGSSGAIAAEITKRLGDDVAKLILVEPWLLKASQIEAFKEDYAPDLTPMSHGGHLLSAFFAVRDAEIFWPWFEPTNEASLTSQALDAYQIHDRAVDMLKAAETYETALKEALDYPLREVLAGLDGDILLAAATTSPRAKSADEAQNQRPQVHFEPWPSNPQAQGQVVLDFIGRV